MKRITILLLACFIACTGCKDTSMVTDSEFGCIMSSPRELERFHYVGTHDKYDFFVGEQWGMHTFGPSAKKTERYFKIENSSYVTNRFPVTQDTQKWILIKPQPEVEIEFRMFTPTEDQLKELGIKWDN